MVLYGLWRNTSLEKTTCSCSKIIEKTYKIQSQSEEQIRTKLWKKLVLKACKSFVRRSSRQSNPLVHGSSNSELSSASFLDDTAGGLLKLTQFSRTPVWLSNWENKKRIIRSTSVYMAYISNFSYLIKNHSKVSTVNQLIVHTSTSYILCDGDVESQARRINQLSIWIISHELPRTVILISGEGVLVGTAT